ncbi:MAG: leucine-rich repeat domain-containing protein [Gammaproteobacteria bacterium]
MSRLTSSILLETTTKAMVACAIALTLVACARPLTVSVNDQAVYDPRGRITGSQALDADLQGCINVAMQQQQVNRPAELRVLSCANSEIRNLANIGRLQRLRFLDLSNNNIDNLTPLEELPSLSALSLVNNRIADIGPLLNIQSLTSVSLLGNNTIPCQQLSQLRQILGNNLTPPDSCRN